MLNNLSVICGEHIDSIGMDIYNLLSKHSPVLNEELVFDRDKGDLLINLNQYNHILLKNRAVYLPLNNNFESIRGSYKGVDFDIYLLNKDYLYFSFDNSPSSLKEEELYPFFRDELEQVLNLLFSYRDNIVYLDSNGILHNRSSSLPPFSKERDLLIQDFNKSLGDIKVLSNLKQYLNSISLPRDVLILQYPERDLHPKYVRLLARFIARLVNINIRILVVTHSDYLIKELNILITGGSLSKVNILLNKGYKMDEIIHRHKVNAYEWSLSILNQSNINEYGMEIKTIDGEIKDINEIYETLIYSDDIDEKFSIRENSLV